MKVQQDVGLERAVLEPTVLVISDKFDEECFVESFIRLILADEQRAFIVWQLTLFILLFRWIIAGSCRSLLEHDHRL